jgi:hypothetical protein
VKIATFAKPETVVGKYYNIAQTARLFSSEESKPP